MTRPDRTRSEKIYYWTILSVVAAMCLGIIVYVTQFYDKESVNKRYFQPFAERHQKRFGG